MWEHEFDKNATEYLEYLDELRKSGTINMYGAGLYLEGEFYLTRREARQVLISWMETFDERHGDSM